MEAVTYIPRNSACMLTKIAGAQIFFPCADARFVRMGLLTCEHAYAQWQPGDGVWTCARCGDDGPGARMSCSNCCRACNACYFLGNPPSHTCCDRQHIIAALRAKNIKPEQIAFPDCGRGKQRWEQAGLRWRDPRRNIIGVRDAQALAELGQLDTDPLEHSDVIKHV